LLLHAKQFGKSPVSTSDEYRPNDDVRQLRNRATRLFALAIKMREDGHQLYAEELIKLASEALAQAVAMERRLARASYEAQLRSNDPKPWTKHVDDGVFAATATVSVSIAFHHQYTPEVIEELTRLRGPAFRQRFDQLRKGADNPAFPDAIKRLHKMVGDMDSALENSPWLVGGEFTLADIAYAPYITRLDYLKFMGMVDGFPLVQAWYDRMRSRPAYQSAIAGHFNPKYLPLMEEKGNEAWPKVATILGLA
jgi:hypothetical protein